MTAQKGASVQLLCLQLEASCSRLSFFDYSCVWEFSPYVWSFLTYSFHLFHQLRAPVRTCRMHIQYSTKLEFSMKLEIQLALSSCEQAHPQFQSSICTLRGSKQNLSRTYLYQQDQTRLKRPCNRAIHQKTRHTKFASSECIDSTKPFKPTRAPCCLTEVHLFTLHPPTKMKNLTPSGGHGQPWCVL